MSDLALSPSDTSIFLDDNFADGVNSCLWGPPGIGKSALVRLAAARYYVSVVGGTVQPNGHVHDTHGLLVPHDVYCHDVRVSLLDPMDMRGFPQISGEPCIKDRRVHWIPPVFLPQDDGSAGVLFLDELNRGNAAAQNACLSLTHDRRLGEYRLPDTWQIAAACNDGGIGTGPMLEALRGRFVHTDCETSLTDWSVWAVANQIHPMVIAYLRFRESKNDPCLYVALRKGERVAPSPRGWEYVSRVCHRTSNPTVLHAKVRGAIGTGHAIECMAYAQMWMRLPSVDSILMAPGTIPVPSEPSVLYALSGALARRCDHANISRVFEYIGRMPGEFAAFAVSDLTTRDPSLCATREFTSWGVASQHAGVI